MKRSLLLCLATTSTFLGAAASARAEVALPPPSCVFAATPNFDAKVPSNVLALVLFDQSAPGVVASNVTATLVPGTASLSVVADSRAKGASLLVLDKALTPSSSYSLDYAMDCNLTSGGPAWNPHPASVATFGTVGSVALPTTSGTLAVVGPEAGSHFTTLSLTPSPELEAYLPVTLFDVSVAGTPWAQLRYGALSMDGGSAKISISGDNVSGQGGSASPGATPLCAAGDDLVKTMHVELTAHVAGMATDPSPLALDVPIDCKKDVPIDAPDASVLDSGPDASGRSDAGPGAASPGAAGTGDAGPDDAGPDDPGAASPGRVSNRGGCQVGPNGDASWLLAAFGVGVTAIAAGARRRRRG